MSARIFLTLTMLLLAVPATAATLSLDGPLEQGALIRGQTDSGARVSLNGNALRVAPASATSRFCTAAPMAATNISRSAAARRSSG